VIDLSKNSDYFKQDQERQKTVQERVKKYLEKVEQVKSNQRVWERTLIEVQSRVERLKRERNLERTWLHVDMDCFYAACEMRDDPTLADVPMAVGDKNMIQTANYLARKFGVRSGTPCFIGRKLCPELQVRKPNFPKYKEASEEFKEVLRNYDPALESTGLDEATLDITDYLQ